MFTDAPARFECVCGDLGPREVPDGIAPRLVEEDDVFAVRDPLISESNAHTSAEWLGEQESLGQGIADEESSDRVRRQRSLLPSQSHVVDL